MLAFFLFLFFNYSDECLCLSHIICQILLLNNSQYLLVLYFSLFNQAHRQSTSYFILILILDQTQKRVLQNDQSNLTLIAFLCTFTNTIMRK